MTHSLTINIVSALNCEAKALVDRFKLKKSTDKPFVKFSGTAEIAGKSVDLTVLISGIGAINMATAVGWLAAQQSHGFSQTDNLVRRTEQQSIWLNLGIAGHGNMQLGEAFIVSASQDLLSSKIYYPPQVARRPVQLSPCLSLNAPSSDYPEEGGLDMECSAFFSASCKFTEAEYVQSFKVVSDTPDDNLENLNAATIHSLIEPHTQKVESYLAALIKLHTSVSGSIDADTVDTKTAATIATVLPRLRATHSQRAQLEHLIKQLTYVLPETGYLMLSKKLTNCDDIASALNYTTQLLSEQRPSLGRA